MITSKKLDIDIPILSTLLYIQEGNLNFWIYIVFWIYE